MSIRLILTELRNGKEQIHDIKEMKLTPKGNIPQEMLEYILSFRSFPQYFIRIEFI